MEASNIEKLRNIMDNISRLNDEWFDTFPTDEGQTGIHDALMYEVMEADKILAASPRNCDVGTVEEQLDRYGLFCQNKCPVCEHRHSCHICGERYRMKCMVAWSQMPYKEGDVK